jgi:glycerate 2-kinase
LRIQNMQMITNHGNVVGRSHVAQMLDAGMDMVDPYIGAKRLISRDKNWLVFNGKEFELLNDPKSGIAKYDLNKFNRVIVIGAAKGIQRCAVALEEILGEYLTGGHVIGKYGDEMLCKKIGVTLAGHPTPDENCIEGCKRIYEWIKDVSENDLIITIAGSGVSSLMTWPTEGVTIDVLQNLTYMMQIEKGALTSDLNAIRNHLDRFKGGRIMRLIKKATIVNLATNDLGGASWGQPGVRETYDQLMEGNRFLPTIPDGTTFGQAIEAFHKYDVWDYVPENIKNYFLTADPKEETLKKEEYEKMNARLFKLTSRINMIYPAIMKKAEEFGYKAYILSDTITAEAAEAGKVISSIALNIQNMNQPVQKPCVLISSGELIVTVGKEKGVGGRNQEFCTAAALKIAGSPKIVIGSVDTDGTDGPGGYIAEGAPTCLSGAIVDGYTCQEAEKKGINLEASLKTHATSASLWALGCGIHAKQSISALDLRVVAIME